jgi:hypothetical protein
MQIGTHKPTTIAGRMSRPVRRRSTDVAPGIDGVSTLFGGWECPEDVIVTRTTYTNEAAAKQERSSVEKLQSSEIQIIDQFGDSFDNVLVLEARTDLSYHPLGVSLEITWRLQQRGAPPSGWQEVIP